MLIKQHWQKINGVEPIQLDENDIILAYKQENTLPKIEQLDDNKKHPWTEKLVISRTGPFYISFNISIPNIFKHKSSVFFDA